MPEPSTSIRSRCVRTTDGQHVTAHQLRPGDSVDIVAQPRPERALFFTLGSLVDRDLRYERALPGVVTQLDQAEHQFVLHRAGTADILVVFGPGTTILRGRQPVSASELLNGQRVIVAGVLDSRAHEIVRADRVDIQPSPGL